MNILLIGVGYHARRIYVPFFFETNAPAHLCAGVDIQSQEAVVTEYLAKEKYLLPMVYLNPDAPFEKLLDDVVKKYKIDAVIISTEPLTHFKYAMWALARNLHILMDKPVSTKKNVANSETQARELAEEYETLKRTYLPLKKKMLVFSLMAQRRFHPAYKFMHDRIQEVFQETNCPVTSIQAFHCDGQWRLPTEIIEQNYHPYNQGYGKLSHSGYHIIDMVVWLVQAAQSSVKKITGADVYSKFIRPADFNYQLSMADHEKILPDFKTYNKFTDSEFAAKTKTFGEIDAFSTIAFRAGDKISSLASINMGHNGFSQRNWGTVAGRDLYKGNGRVRQEQYFIEQGPFQSISLLTYQSKEVLKESSDLYRIGGEHHLEVHVFRNSTLIPHWKTYERFSLEKIENLGYMRGHQEDARRAGILDFISAIQNKREAESDFLDHEVSTKLLSAMYTSNLRGEQGKNPVVNVDLSRGGFTRQKKYWDAISAAIVVHNPFKLKK